MMIIAMLVAILVIATVDPHPKSAGRARRLFEKATYPKVAVHFLGGAALFGLMHGHIWSRILLVGFIALCAALYESVQWLNPLAYYFNRGPVVKERGIFSVWEVVATALGAILCVASELALVTGP